MNQLLTEVLKIETRKLHSETEVKLNSRLIFSDEYHMQSYFSHLLDLYKGHVALNQIIEANQMLFPDPELIPDNRCVDLMEDINNIDPQFEVHKVLFDKSIEIDLPFLLGISYVLKGSELGGAIIGKQINRHAERWGIPSAHFYKEVTGEKLKLNWRKWCQNVNTIPACSEFKSRAVEGANFGFQIFIQTESLSIQS